MKQAIFPCKVSIQVYTSGIISFDILENPTGVGLLGTPVISISNLELTGVIGENNTIENVSGVVKTGDIFVSKITRESIDHCKSVYRNDINKNGWRLMKEIKDIIF